MRKSMMDETPSLKISNDTEWLVLDQLASAEITSEDVAYPVENALLLQGEGGWRAGFPGKQTLRLVFDTPQRLSHIRLWFIERTNERSQEFVLRWSPDDGQTFYEIVRQQWNFNLVSAPEEIENYQVDLVGVTHLELTIIPERSGGDARASLAQLRLA